MDRRGLIVGLLWDVGIPAAVYYGCRAVGVDTWYALAAAGLVALLRVAYVAVARRRLDGVAAVVGGVFALLLVVSAVTGDPRVLLARESIVSGALGLLLLGSLVVGRPVLYALMRRFNAGNAELLARWDQRWRGTPGFRRIFVLTSLVWGVGLLAEALIRIVLIYLLPVDVMAGVSTVLQLATIVLLVGWSLAYRRRRAQAVLSGAR